jgi:restriction system protein
VVAGLAYAFCQAAPKLIRFDSPLLAALNVFVGLLPNFAHWPAPFLMIVAGVAALSGYRRRRLLNTQSGIESIRELSWQDFELLVGEWFRQQGFAFYENGGGRADGGVDLRLSRDGKTSIVQRKRWKWRQIGVVPIRELFGLMTAENAAGAYFVACGEYSRAAERFASDVGLVFGSRRRAGPRHSPSQDRISSD